jgi:glycosyltransferase involved in cell wall biosynthesis
MDKPLQTDFEVKSITSGYSEKNSTRAFRLYKLGQIKGGKGPVWKMRYRKRVAFRQLEKSALPQLDVAYVDYATSGVLLMNYFEAHNIPFIVHVHGYDVTSNLNDKAYAVELDRLFKKATYIITPSKHIARLLVTLGCNTEKIKPIYPITNLNLINEPSWPNRLKSKPIVSFLGRLTEKKNPLALVQAFNIVSKTISEVEFYILGDGPLKGKVNELISHLNLNDKIKVVGLVNRETAFQYLKKSWVYAQHSVTATSGDQEGFPVSLAEAAAHSLPLVSTIHSGIPENIIDGKTGFLVQEYNYETMAEKIIYLIRHPHIAEQMGKAGREHILKLCEPNKRVRLIKELLIKASATKQSIN